MPADPLPGRALIYLHGVRERWLQELPVLRDLVEAARLPVIAPRAGRSWWLDHVVPSFDPALTAERYVIGPVVAEIARRFGVSPPGIAVVGTSMGGQGSLRLAYRHPNLFPVAAAISPANSVTTFCDPLPPMGSSTARAGSAPTRCATDRT